MKQGDQLELLRNKSLVILTLTAVTRPSLTLVSERHAGKTTDNWPLHEGYVFCNSHRHSEESLDCSRTKNYESV